MFLEKINGRFQGAAMRFTQGLVAGNNRLAWGPDNALYVGGIGPGDSSNWSWRGTWYGLQRLAPNGADAFEIQTIRAVQGGFILTFTKPVDSSVLSNVSNYETVENWTYDGQSYGYGSGQTNLSDLTVTLAEPLSDGRSVRLTIPSLAEETVVHIQAKDTVISAEGEPLWSGEAFYTLNAFPNEFESAWAEWVTEHFSGVADLDVIGPSANPDGDANNNFSEFVGGSNPTIVDSLDTMGIAAFDSLSFDLTQREIASLPSPLTATWESSTDLNIWTDVSDDVSFIESSSLGDGTTETTYRYSPPANTPKLFMRRVVTNPVQ